MIVQKDSSTVDKILVTAFKGLGKAQIAEIFRDSLNSAAIENSREVRKQIIKSLIRANSNMDSDPTTYHVLEEVMMGFASHGKKARDNGALTPRSAAAETLASASGVVHAVNLRDLVTVCTSDKFNLKITFGPEFYADLIKSVKRDYPGNDFNDFFKVLAMHLHGPNLQALVRAVLSNVSQFE